MKIAFRPQRRVERVELRDLTGGSPHATWTVDDVRDIPDNDYSMVRDPDGEVVRRKTIDAILSAGPDFVDAATGTNPRFASVRSGEHALDDGFVNLQTLQFVPYADEHGGRLTIAEFLSDHPEFIGHHERAGLSHDVIDHAKQLAAAKAPVVASKVPLAQPKVTLNDTAHVGQG